MSVGDGDIEPRVVVVVEERDAESDIWTRRRSNPARHRDVREPPAVDVDEEAVHLGLVVGHDQSWTPIATEVSKRRPHAGSWLSVGGNRNAGKEGHLGKGTAAGVVKEEIGRCVVGDKHIRPTIVVDVGHGNPKTIPADRRHTALGADVLERLAGISIEDAS